MMSREAIGACLNDILLLLTEPAGMWRHGQECRLGATIVYCPVTDMFDVNLAPVARPPRLAPLPFPDERRRVEEPAGFLGAAQ